MAEISYSTEKREIGILMDQIDKQYFTVGKHLQDFLVAKKQEEGKELKTIRDYMESQRSYVWETWRASNLIQTVLLKNPMPEVTVYRADDKSQFRKTVDGQQRLTTLYLFINDQLKLDMTKTIFPEFKIEGELFNAMKDLHGKTFSELPELWQDIIKFYQLRMTTMNNCSEEFAEKAFVQMNSGAKGLKASEIRKAAMGITTRKFFRSILDSDWVLHALTALSAKGNAGDEILSQVITLIHNGKALELSKDNIDKVIYSFRDEGVPEQIQDDIANVSNYLNEVTEIWINNKKKDDEKQGNGKGRKVKNYATYRFPWFSKKTNTVMLMYSAYQAIKNSITVDQFASWAFDFFQNPNAEYKEGLQDKAIDLKRVELRMSAIDNEINKISGNDLNIMNQEQLEQSNPEVTKDEINSIMLILGTDDYNNESNQESSDIHNSELSEDQENLNEEIQEETLPSLTLVTTEEKESDVA